MRRLRAVVNPAPAAGRGPRLMALGLAGVIVALAGAGSLAVAGEREAVLRMSSAPAPRDEGPAVVDLGSGSRALLNGEPLPEGLPMWAISAERLEVRTVPAGAGEMNFILPFTSPTPVSVNGRLMPAGFPAKGVSPEAVARVDVVGDHVMYTLKPEAEVRRARTEAAADRQATAESAEADFTARLSNASAADYRLFCAAAEGTMDRTACSMLLWDAAGAEQSAAAPAFCAPNRTNADLEVIAERGRAVALTGPAGRGSAQDAARRALIAAFPCEGAPRAVPAEAVARASASLGAEWEQRYGVSARAESAARRAAYAAATGADYQRMCASQDPGDSGYCAGILFGTAITEARSASPAFCAPEQEDRAATMRFVQGAKAGVAQVQVSAGQSPGEVARAGLIRAYPCEATQAAAFRTQLARVQSFVPLTVAVDIEGRPLSVQGDKTLRVVLTDGNGVVMNTHGTVNSGSDRVSAPLGPLGMAIAPGDFPGPGEATRVYTLTGEVRGPDRVLRYVAEPVTLRLAPGARHADLRPTLSFRPA